MFHLHVQSSNLGNGVQQELCESDVWQGADAEVSEAAERAVRELLQSLRQIQHVTVSEGVCKHAHKIFEKTFKK